VADGPELEAAHARSLAHGTRWEDLLAALDAASEHLPCAVMTYANPVWRRGLDAAARELKAHGASGLVVPDLGFEESLGAWRRTTAAHGLALVRFASPATPEPRLERIARAATGFLYLLSHYGTTGRTRSTGAVPDLRPLLALAHAVRPRLPVLVGFGVRRPSDVARWRSQGADGVAVGSAFERRLAARPNPDALARFVRPLARAARAPSGASRA
jgi:tryptophan synthase alpha chain